MKRIWIIYKAVHETAGSYIGATVSSLSNRRSTHRSAAKRGSTTPFHVALRSYPCGWCWDILKVCESQEDAYIQEEHYVSATSPTLNVKLGGLGGGKWPVNQRYKCRSKNKRTVSKELRSWFSEFHKKRQRRRLYDRQKMILMHQAGAPISKIAATLGCDSGLVSRVISGKYKP